jgi:hypothetical protein
MDATFKGADRSVLLLLSEGPAPGTYGLELGEYGGRVLQSCAEDERALAAAGRAIDGFLDCCEDIVRNTGHSVRYWLRSQIPG